MSYLLLVLGLWCAHAQDAPDPTAPVPTPETATPADGAPPTGAPLSQASGPPPLGNEAGASGTSGVSSGVTTGSQTVAAPRSATATFPSGQSDPSGVWLIGGGLAALGLAVVAWLALRGQNAGSAVVLPSGVRRLSEPAFLGVLPSLSDGLQLWNVDGSIDEAVLTGVLGALARRHRVLVVAPADVSVPRVFGGPVFEVDGLRPVHLEDPAAAMAEDGGRLPAVLLVLPTGANPAEYADVLPPSVGGVVLAHDAGGPLPVVRVAQTAEDGAWVAIFEGCSSTLRPDVHGAWAPA